MSLKVFWDGRHVGDLELDEDSSRSYGFQYAADASRPISLALPLSAERYGWAASRPFFEALLPEGIAREQIAALLRQPAGDSYGLLAALGQDCAGALQIVSGPFAALEPRVRWLTGPALERLVQALPRSPLGIDPQARGLRLSLAGVQRKAVLVRDPSGRFGLPLGGMPSTHILKPQFSEALGGFPDLAVNEFFCMRLARMCGLEVADVELIAVGELPCLVVRRFDRDLSQSPVRRIHQEDMCQALGLAPEFKYQQPELPRPSLRAIAAAVNDASLQPGVDRLALARAAIFNFVIGNADAHAKNVALLHVDAGIRLAPLYDLVSTTLYPELSPRLALSIGDTFDSDRIGVADWGDLAIDLGLNPRAFERERLRLSQVIPARADELIQTARREGWHVPRLDQIATLTAARALQL